MLPAFIIGLREGVEAALIVGIIASFLAARGQQAALRWVWIGVGLAAVLCLAAGIALEVANRRLPQKEQEGLETIVALIAVAMVTYMLLWMRRHARSMRVSLESDLSEALESGSMRALVAMAFLAVLREGLETAVFLVAAFQNSTNPQATGAGAILGLLVATVIGYALYRGGMKINLARFFRVTGLVLVVVAAGLTASALHTAHEAGWVNILQDEAFDLSWLVRPGTVLSALVTGMFGIQPRPTVIEVIGWLVYFVPVAIYVAWPSKRVPGRSNTLQSSPAQ